MLLREVDWIPPYQFKRMGQWHYKRAYATFKSNAGCFRVEVLTDTQVLVKGQSAGLGLVQMDLLSLNALLIGTEARQNPRRCKRRQKGGDEA